MKENQPEPKEPAFGRKEDALIINGITLLSGVDPKSRCEKIANAAPSCERTLYLCPSPVYGWGLDVLYSRLDRGSCILCIEADPRLASLFREKCEPALAADKRLRFVYLPALCETDVPPGSGEGYAAQICQKLFNYIRNVWGALSFRRLEIVKLTGGFQLYRGLYSYLFENLRKEIATDWSNALTLTKLGRLYTRNLLCNLSLIGHFPSAGKLSFGSSPILVLGAGPSLDVTLAALQKHFKDTLCTPRKRPFKIICADTCLGSLKDRNIPPDLAVVLESQHWNLGDFIGCAGWDISCAFDLSSHPRSAYLLAGGSLKNGFLFATPWTSLNIFERLKIAGLLPAELAPLGSVGNTSVELARLLTKGNIILAGLDFSFTQERFHARGTQGHKRCLNSLTRFRSVYNSAAFGKSAVWTVSKSGEKVLTNPALLPYRDVFERQFAGDARIFDIEGSGLALGVKTLSIEEAVEILKNNNSHGDTGITEEQEDSLCPEESNQSELRGKVEIFIEGEKKRLIELRDILSGDAAADSGRLETLIEECDYVWAHFPDLSGGRQPDITDISFLKRLRIEIDLMLKVFNNY